MTMVTTPSYYSSDKRGQITLEYKQRGPKEKKGLGTLNEIIAFQNHTPRIFFYLHLIQLLQVLIQKGQVQQLHFHYSQLHNNLKETNSNTVGKQLTYSRLGYKCSWQQTWANQVHKSICLNESNYVMFKFIEQKKYNFYNNITEETNNLHNRLKIKFDWISDNFEKFKFYPFKICD